MASKYSHDVCFGQPIKDSDKKRWIKIGAAFTDEQGRLSIKLDCVPLGVDPARGCWLSLFEAKPRESGQTAATFLSDVQRQQVFHVHHNAAVRGLWRAWRGYCVA
jgi:hypothetical protein